MTYLKIEDALYPAEFRGIGTDRNWGDRHSVAITTMMTHDEAVIVFVDGLNWSIVTVSDGEETEQDMTEFEVAGPITDNRNGTVTVKMGKFTDADALAVLTGEV